MAFSLLHNNDNLFDVNSEPYFRLPKTLTFKMGLSAACTFLIKMRVFLYENERSFPHLRLST